MKLTDHQPAYLPWLGLFHKIANSDAYYYLENVQYVPEDNINRNYIKTFSGKILLSVPVLKKGFMQKTISDMEINNNIPWRKKHWMTILLNYRKAPFFAQYADFWEDVYLREWKYLTDLNFYLLCWHLETLGIKTKVIRDKEYMFKGKKSALIVEMCKKCNADHFLFGAMGETYAEKELFQKENIKIAFQHYNHPEYHQLHGPFMPYMACIDLIFNEGPRALDIIMSGNCSSQEMQYH